MAIFNCYVSSPEGRKSHENSSKSGRELLNYFQKHAVDTLWWTYKKQLKMAIEIVDVPMKNGDFPLLC